MHREGMPVDFASTSNSRRLARNVALETVRVSDSATQDESHVLGICALRRNASKAAGKRI